MLKAKVKSMSAVAEKLRLELDKLAKEAKDEETQKEIAKWKIRLQSGSLKGKVEPGTLSMEEREDAVLALIRQKGWDTSWAEESIRKRRQGLK